MKPFIFIYLLSILMANDNLKASKTAVFGAGCFWCVEAVFEQIKGVKSVVSGYAGGTTENPTYDEVCQGTTGHAEICQIHYDPDVISYETLLEVFWLCHDPTMLNQQGNDTGTQYRSIILYEDEPQKKAAENAIAKAAAQFSDKIVTEVVCKDADQIIVSGSGDAFGSVLHRDFMRKFDKKNYPKVEFIYPMTNAVLWDKKMWDSMKGVHPYVKSCYISIDAVTSETYNKVRTLKPSHGNFEQLIENLKFINTIPDLKRIALTFVVSELNYFEVDKFLDMKRYFPDKDIEFRYYKIMDWGHLGKKYGEYAINEENNPNYKDFLG